MKNMKDNRLKPVESQEEADSIRKYLAEETAKALNIPMTEANIRVENLICSGLLETGTHDDPQTQMRIEMFLKMPSHVTVGNHKLIVEAILKKKLVNGMII